MSAHFSPESIDAGLAEPDADPDGDGQTNRSEFTGASNPNAATSFFRANFERTGPETGEISYPSSFSRLYAVEQMRDDATGWQQILPPLPGNGGLMTRSLEIPGPRGFFRIRAEVP